jgi:hypothetical protein
MSLPLSSTAIQKPPTTPTFLHPQISPAGAPDLSGDGDAEVVLGIMSFAEERRTAEARARREAEAKAAEERRQLKLKRKLLMLQICLALVNRADDQGVAPAAIRAGDRRADRGGS